MMSYSHYTLRAPNSHLTQCRHGKSRVLDEITNSRCVVTVHVLLPSIVHVNPSISPLRPTRKQSNLFAMSILTRHSYLPTFSLL
jgi:hypothetical protein